MFLKNAEKKCRKNETRMSQGGQQECWSKFEFRNILAFLKDRIIFSFSSVRITRNNELTETSTENRDTPSKSEETSISCLIYTCKPSGFNDILMLSDFKEWGSNTEPKIRSLGLLALIAVSLAIKFRYLTVAVAISIGWKIILSGLKRFINGKCWDPKPGSRWWILIGFLPRNLDDGAYFEKHVESFNSKQRFAN